MLFKWFSIRLKSWHYFTLVWTLVFQIPNVSDETEEIGIDCSILQRPNGAVRQGVPQKWGDILVKWIFLCLLVCNVVWNAHTHGHLDHMVRSVVFHGSVTSEGTRLCLKTSQAMQAWIFFTAFTYLHSQQVTQRYMTVMHNIYNSSTHLFTWSDNHPQTTKCKRHSFAFESFLCVTCSWLNLH